MIRAYELKRGFYIEEGTGKTRIIQDDGVFIPYPYLVMDVQFMAALRDLLTKWCYEADKGETYPTNHSNALLLAAFDKRNLPLAQRRKELFPFLVEYSNRTESEKREVLCAGENNLPQWELNLLDTYCRFFESPSQDALLHSESAQNKDEENCPSSTSKCDE